jgi:predicted metal-binding membrane protein
MSMAPGGVTRSPLSATRSELAMVAALLAAAGLAWWATADRMAGMDAGPGTALGSAGWFTGVWVTMMAAMMLPSLAPTAAVFAASVRRNRLGARARQAMRASRGRRLWCGIRRLPS